MLAQTVQTTRAHRLWWTRSPRRPQLQVLSTFGQWGCVLTPRRGREGYDTWHCTNHTSSLSMSIAIGPFACSRRCTRASHMHSDYRPTFEVVLLRESSVFVRFRQRNRDGLTMPSRLAAASPVQPPLPVHDRLLSRCICSTRVSQLFYYRHAKHTCASCIFRCDCWQGTPLFRVKDGACFTCLSILLGHCLT